MESFRKRLGKHIFWFDSLKEKSKLDILFKYKQEKYLFRGVGKFPFTSRIYSYMKLFRAPQYKIRNTKLEELLK